MTPIPYGRLQTGRTQWYCKMLLLFTALFVCKHGAATAASSVEGVQPGLFNQLLQNVSLRPSYPSPPPTCLLERIRGMQRK